MPVYTTPFPAQELRQRYRWALGGPCPFCGEVPDPDPDPDHDTLFPRAMFTDSRVWAQFVHLDAKPECGDALDRAGAEIRAADEFEARMAQAADAAVFGAAMRLEPSRGRAGGLASLTQPDLQKGKSWLRRSLGL